VVGSGLWAQRSLAGKATIGGLPVIKSEYDLDFQWPGLKRASLRLAIRA
jgi:hypothetical protein